MFRSISQKILLVGVAFAAGACPLPAAVQSRITRQVSNATRQTVPDTVHARARLGADMGATAGSTRLQGMTLRFSMTDAQQAALDQLLSDQQNPSSSRYHQWLTPAQYGAQFGLSADDLAKVTTWLTSQGFSIDEVGKSGTFVRFSGTVAQAQAAFSTSIHNVAFNGLTYFANITDATVPTALGEVVSGLTGLHDFKLKARVRSRQVQAPATHTLFTSSVSGNHYIAPGDFYTIYNETPSLISGLNGSGISVAIMGQIDISTTDIAAFRTAAGLASSTITMQTYGTDPGTGSKCSSSSSVNCPTPNLDDLSESSLDVEWAGAVAPGANIIFVKSSDVIGLSLTDAIDNNLAPIMSVSYGDCESAWGTSELNILNALFKQANAQGITVLGPAGDDGATDCDYQSTTATQGLAVDFPASSPNVTAVGGTMYNEGSATGGTTSWLATDGTITAGSAVTGATYSATGYLPEAVWNEDVTGSAFSAGGGGPSAFFSKPAWQVGTPADASRDLPDLALNSAANHDGYLYCVSSSCLNGTFRASDGQTLTVGGGTSFATPSFAGILALVEQKTGSRLGNVNPTIYALGNNTTFYNNTSTSVFHDVTTGNNNSACTAGTPNCSSGGTIGFSAGAGYDLATGWGSVNVNNLLNSWSLITPLGLGTTGLGYSCNTVSSSPASVAAGATVTFTATLSGAQVTNGLSGPVTTCNAGQTPTGSAQFLVNNTVVGSPVSLVNGVATYTYTTSCAQIGKLSVAASYSGDATYAGSKASGITSAGSSSVSPVQVTVTSGSCPDFTIAAANSSLTVTSGTPNTTLSIGSVNGFAGTVALSASATESSSTLPTLLFNPASVTLTSGGTATTTLTLSNITAELRKPAALPASKPGSRVPWYESGSGITAASLLVFVLPRRRRFGTLLLIALSAALGLGVSGCGGNNTAVSPNSNPSAGTYTVTVTASGTPSGSTVSHTTTVVFTVQ